MEDVDNGFCLRSAVTRLYGVHDMLYQRTIALGRQAERICYSDVLRSLGK